MDQPFKLIVAGGRDFSDRDLLAHTICQVCEALKPRQLIIVSGMARGADLLAYEFAKECDEEVMEFPADWDKYGKRAGYVRNNQMAEVADGLLAFWDGQSRGTKHMIETMENLGKPVQIISY